MRRPRHYLRENPPPLGFRIIPIYPDEDTPDNWLELVDAARDLFDDAGIQLANYEDPALAGVVPTLAGYQVVGAIFGGNRGPDDTADANIRFSAVVHPAHQRTGIWRALATQYVRDMRGLCGGEPELRVKLEGWVVNPNTIPVLESLGFEHWDGGSWSSYSPFYWKWI